MLVAKSLEDFYELLEVSPNVSKEVMHAAFQTLMKRYHPDQSGGDDGRAKRISEAFAVLSSPEARAKYERDFRNFTGEAVGEYRILSKIAEGGFGCTYKAEHATIGELACIKHCHNVDSEYEEILLEETQIMWDLRHYSVPAVRGLLRMPDNKLALVMSYVPGPTLAQVIEKVSDTGERLDPEHVAWIAERVLNALRYIHYQGVVHGDLKPHNIIIEPDKHLASIVDFGLAKVKPRAKEGNKGFTAIFSAPEVVDGKTIIPESDMYSLGMTMIYALSCDVDRLIRKEIPSDTPELMRRFIQRLIVRDPLSRPSWSKTPGEEDLWDEFLEVRGKSFGRNRSKLKPIPGF